MSYLREGEYRDQVAAGTLDPNRCLFLENHATLVRQWEVNSYDARALALMGDAISRFAAVSIWKYRAFRERADEQGYQIVFLDDPQPIFDWFQSLSREPEVEIASAMAGTIKGFLPFQVQGVNFMTACERAIYFNWSTGTGKTIAAEGTILTKAREWEQPGDGGYDLCIYMVKPNNLVGAERKLLAQAGLEACIFTGTQKRREKMMVATYGQMQAREQPILITNAEKFREDCEGWQMLVEDRKVLFIFDEMPSKFANRQTALYRALCSIMYTSETPQGVPYPDLNRKRPADMFSVAMSATPISNSPEDVFNCVRLVDPTIFGSVLNFSNLFVARRNEWFQVTRWKNLDLMSAMMTSITHQADKERDPEIKAQFPRKLPPETVFVDLHPQVERVYKALEKEYQEIAKGKSTLSHDDMLSAITCFQMVTNNPRGVLISAEKRDDFDLFCDAEEARLVAAGYSEHEVAWRMTEFSKANAQGSAVAQRLRDLVGPEKLTDRDKSGECIVTKLTELRDRIQKYGRKVIVFTRFNETLLPLISEWFLEWGIEHVCFPAGGQEAIDLFRTDPSIMVFLSTDAGSDSIDLPEATKTYNYDLPLTYARLVQRDNRQDRIDSVEEEVQVITLIVPGTVEDRFAEIVAIKRAYHEAVLGGEVAEASLEYRNDDLFYVLTGARLPHEL